MNVIERTRTSGKCPPSLFRDEPLEDTFEAAVAKIIDPNGTFAVGIPFVQTCEPERSR